MTDQTLRQAMMMIPTDWDFGTNLQYPVLKIDVNGDGTADDPADLRCTASPRLSVVIF